MSEKVKELEKVYTYQTRLGVREEFYEFFEDFLPEYNKAFREIYSEVKKGVLSNKEKHKYNSELQLRYGYSQRMCNSLIHLAVGRLNSLKEIVNLNIRQKKLKIEDLKGKIVKKEKEFIELEEIVRINKVSEVQLVEYRKLKLELYYKKNSLNKKRQLLENLEAEVAKGNYKQCLGSKKLFKAQYHLELNGFNSHQEWLAKFRAKRDSSFTMNGTKGEICGNQEFRLMYNYEKNNFDLAIRIPEKNVGKYGEYIKVKGVDFRYKKWQRSMIISLLLGQEVKSERTHGFSYRIRKVGNKFYLDLMLKMKRSSEVDSFNTSKLNGVVGIDFNDGFISVSEVNAQGDLVSTRDIYYDKTKGANYRKTELSQNLSKVMDCALKCGYDIVHERLDFNKKKVKLNKGIGSEYNRMLSNLDYANFISLLENGCYRRGIYRHEVFPANTSKVGKGLYMDSLGISVHQAAAFVIGRLGLGLEDEFEGKKTYVNKYATRQVG